ncbi:MAG TPA: hypothetical protein VFZ52_04560 [Chryseolinea sp.]
MSNTHLEDKPPVFKSWKGWYYLILGVLVVQIILYYLLTNSFKG